MILASRACAVSFIAHVAHIVVDDVVVFVVAYGDVVLARQSATKLVFASPSMQVLQPQSLMIVVLKHSKTCRGPSHICGDAREVKAFSSACGIGRNTVRQDVVLQLFCQGHRLVFYGDEVHLQGGHIWIYGLTSSSPVLTHSVWIYGLTSSWPVLNSEVNLKNIKKACKNTRRR